MPDDAYPKLQAKYPLLFSQAAWCDCPPGWFAIVDALAAELTAKYPDVRCGQVKEKFGGLRFYTHGASEEAQKVISACEAHSYKTCQEWVVGHFDPSGSLAQADRAPTERENECGEPGTPVSKGGWERTVCAAHRS